MLEFYPIEILVIKILIYFFIFDRLIIMCKIIYDIIKYIITYESENVYPTRQK